MCAVNRDDSEENLSSVCTSVMSWWIFQSTHHYFFECNLHNQHRQIILISVNTFETINLELILNGTNKSILLKKVRDSRVQKVQ